MPAEPTVDLHLNRISRLRIQHLRLICVIGESETLSQAAERLQLTQSAASKMLRDVENAFGVRLFERGRTGARPTAGGRALVLRVSRLLHDIEAARQEQAQIARGMSVLLRIGGLPVALVTLMPAVFALCRQRWPGLLLQTREATARQLVVDVLNGIVDCGLGRIYPADQIEESESRLIQDRLRPEEIVIVASLDHPLASDERPTMAALLSHDWILPPPGTVTRAAFALALQQLGLALPRAVLESDASFGTILSYVREFGLLALMPQTVALREAGLGTVRVLPVALEVRLPPLAFVCLRARAEEPDIARFRRIVTEAARSG
jgi:DNA-binding transcriptional LysR family regulator